MQWTPSYLYQTLPADTRLLSPYFPQMDQLLVRLSLQTPISDIWDKTHIHKSYSNMHTYPVPTQPKWPRHCWDWACKPKFWHLEVVSPYFWNRTNEKTRLLPIYNFPVILIRYLPLAILVKWDTRRAITLFSSGCTAAVVISPRLSSCVAITSISLICDDNLR